MELDLQRVVINVRKATTEDLLDRATIYRSDMEPAALRIIDEELIQRGITVEQVEAHLEVRNNTLHSNDGVALKCSFCWKPAIETGWDWQRLYGRIPVFPRRFRWCEEHLPPGRKAKRRALNDLNQDEPTEADN